MQTVVGESSSGSSASYGSATSGAAERARASLVAMGVEMGTLAGRFAGATGLHPTDVRALWVLAEPDAPRTAGELGTRLDLSSGAATRTVDRLEGLGYVERVRDPKDRRRVGLHLTREAEEVTRKFFGRVATVVEGVIESYAEAELAVVARFLTQVCGAVRGGGYETSQTATEEPAGDHAQ